MPVTWSDEVDEILASDLTAGVAYLTPAKGVVIAPMCPLALRDRETGKVTITSSLAMWKKLDRIRRNNGIAIAYHTREHALTDRPGFVLVQGRASFSTTPDRAWLESIEPQWETFLGKRHGGPLGRMLDAYYWQRIGIEVDIERLLAYPDTEARGEPQLFGSPPPHPPDSQPPPKKGTEPRISTSALVKGVDEFPDTLLGWCGGDGLPEMTRVEAAEESANGVRLHVPEGSVPAGERRAGLTSHSFGPRMRGQHQRMYTGWLQSDGGSEVTYSPHTKAGYDLPRSDVAYTLACIGIAARMRSARKAGLVG